MTRPSFHIRDLELTLELTLLGRLLVFDFHPFRYQEITFRGPRDCLSSQFNPHDWSWHWFCGPLHVWGSTGFSNLFEISFCVSQNPVYGGKLTPKGPRATKAGQ